MTLSILYASFVPADFLAAFMIYQLFMNYTTSQTILIRMDKMGL